MKDHRIDLEVRNIPIYQFYESKTHDWEYLMYSHLIQNHFPLESKKYQWFQHCPKRNRMTKKFVLIEVITPSEVKELIKESICLESLAESLLDSKKFEVIAYAKEKTYEQRGFDGLPYTEYEKQDVAFDLATGRAIKVYHNYIW